MVSFAWFVTNRPRTLPIHNDTAMKIAREAKYSGGLAGGSAPKAAGAAKYMIVLIIMRWINADRNSVTTPKYTGTPFA